jgi:hypothetical protein
VERQSQGSVRDEEGNESNREIDQEDPTPAGVVDDEAPDQRTENAARSEDARDEADVLAAFAGRNDVSDDCESE